MADSGSNTVFDFYTSSYIIVGKRPSGVASTPDGKKVFVTNTDDNTVSVIDTTTNKVTATVNVGINPYGVAVTPDGKKVFVTNANSKNVTIIDTATNKVTATVNLGSDPISFGQFIGPASPVADFVASPTTGRAPFKVAFTEKNTGLLTSRAWLFGDGATSTARNPMHVYSKPGTYNVLLKVTNGAGSNSKIKFSYITVQQARS
jgi:YVTN family beta-propeller protein